MGKILTIQEAKELRLKPWKADLDNLAKQFNGDFDIKLNNAVGYILAKTQIEKNLSITDIYIRLGDFDDAFILSNHTTMIRGIDLNTIHLIVEMWDKIKKELSDNFVDNNQAVCENAIALLEKVRTNGAFDKLQCNEVINRLYEKGKVKEVEDVETVDALETREA